eukprot:457731-Pelagomonas_calceolata.AAC.1
MSVKVSEVQRSISGMFLGAKVREKEPLHVIPAVSGVHIKCCNELPDTERWASKCMHTKADCRLCMGHGGCVGSALVGVFTPR